MTTGVVTIAGNTSGSPLGSRTITPLPIIATAAVDQTQVVALSSGNNTITVPTGATCVVIVGPNGTSPQPNPASATVLTLKGVAGDTGVVMSAKWPTVLSWDTAPASFVINATVLCNVEIWSM